MKPLFIIIPSNAATGPVKGAIALAKSLSSHFQIILITLRGEPVSLAHNFDISSLSLSTYSKTFFW